MYLIKSALTSAAIFTLAFASFSHAIEPPSDEWQVRLGGGAAAADLPWKGIESELISIPIIDIQKGNWFINKDSLIGYRFPITEDLSVYSGLGYRQDGYDGVFRDAKSEDEVFEGYDAPDGDITVNYGITYLWFTLAGHSDISDNSDSTTATFSVSIPLYNNGRGFKVSAVGNVEWQQSDYVNYIYGVSGKNIDISRGRLGYLTTDDAVNYSAGLTVHYQLKTQLSLVGGITRTKLDDVIANSPLLDRDTSDLAYAGLVYQF
ncbi:MipA/OmpV family protein [Pseudoalteromonas piscicida]|uniref:MipA/OmpV family protein n=1 Tax=Pseudoalteromonas piscicida TaxID=43662 RepID=A0AAD0RHJ2_PSEO7|nr:MipA/OmpV family protein [Pseudoalteromonas piscicida]ASD67544.1 structural protein MipA [Pseudoalteromonas piscicida]AXQ98520.1 MipA/OmpV family protein [Pseudoalteromonas piscicida]AXR01754.1 MipA/OmpV family protein [Pseudoalteromonas piscicida]